MAFLEMHFQSEALKQGVSVNILLPDKVEGDKFKTLWLLHGQSDDHTSWMRYTSVERYTREYGLAVVMPCADRSWYTDTAYGPKYFTYITQELPEKMALWFRGYSDAKEDNLIIGLSMGGYGALKATMVCPEKYDFCASLSGALDITRKNRPYSLEQWQGIFGFQLQSAEELKGTQHDLFALAESGKKFPHIYLWCGTEDSLLEANKAFSAQLSALGIPHTFQYSEGRHNWKYWDIHLQSALACWQGLQK